MSAAVATLEPALPRLTYEEFLDWADGMNAEWVDGEVILMSPQSDKHLDIAFFLNAVLRIYANRRGLGVVRGERCQMKTAPDLPGREPDVLFLARENLSRLKGTYISGPADLVIEIISLESRERDRGAKFLEYEIGGVREYWLIDPTREMAQFYQRGDDGMFHEVLPDDDGRYNSAVIPGVWVMPNWFWQDPLPDELEVLEGWGL
jgi:Uma2 family endonuclease